MTSSAAAFPVNPSPSPANDGHKTIPDGFGPSSHDAFAYYDPEWYSSKTSQDFSLPAGCSPEDAYAAGLIDGEGCLTIRKSHDWYSATVEVGMTEPALPLLHSMQQRYGGKVTKQRNATAKWGAAHRWRIFGAEATAFVKKIRPMLRLKKEQADILLALETVHRRSPEAGALKNRINQANAKGPKDARVVGGAWLKTQQSLLAEHQTYSETWPRSGMMRNGTAYRRPPLVPRTYVTEFSLWPTPRTTGLDGGCNSRAAAKARGMWPTPKSSPSGPDFARINREGSGGDDLATAVARERFCAALLNPMWVEWLQGFPPNWTEVE